jgi:uncharacterized SAM-binding protein YcdF (DUF218 family)
LTDFIFVVSKLAWFVLRPNQLALLLAIAGVVLLWRGRRGGQWLAGLGLGYYAAVLVLPLATWLTLPLEERFARPAPAPAQVDGIIILGGAVDQILTEARGIPALNGAAERMTEAVVLARRYPAARLVFTGGQASLLYGGVTEADVARQLWSAMGLAAAQVTYEAAARNTHENAVLTQALMRPQPGEVWLLVTSAAHMPRSVGIFRRIGWPVVAWPVNYTTTRDPAFWWDSPFAERLGHTEWALREWLGLVVYRLLGRTDSLLPAP